MTPIRRGARRRLPSDPTTGRLTILTPELHKQVVDIVRAGNYIRDAARYVGVTDRTLWGWLARGRTEIGRLDDEIEAEAHRTGHPIETIDEPPLDPIEEPFLRFFLAVQSAQAEARVRNVSFLQRADQPWQARAWWLERTAPDEYGRQDRTTVALEGTTGPPVRVDTTDEQDRARKREILEVLIDTGAVETYELPEGDDDNDGDDE